MSKYIDAEKLKAEIEKRLKNIRDYINGAGMKYKGPKFYKARGKESAYDALLSIIDSLQQEQPANMIQWTGNNLKEVIDFTGKSPKFGEWFNSWEEFETYVHQHNDILKLFCADGSHYEVPVGAWIVKTPDGHNVPSAARFIPAKQEQPEEELTEFEQTLKNGTNIYVEQGRHMEDWDARQDAKDLMEIARKELQREIDVERKEDLRTEYEKCRADALKDLPNGCW